MAAAVVLTMTRSRIPSSPNAVAGDIVVTKLVDPPSIKLFWRGPPTRHTRKERVARAIPAQSRATKAARKCGGDTVPAGGGR
jgi:hypothetical protein